MEEIKKERKKRVPNPNLPKHCGFRMDVGELFWYMTLDNEILVPVFMRESFESRHTITRNGEKIENKSSVSGILAENGNYYRTEEDCSNRIKLIINSK